MEEAIQVINDYINTLNDGITICENSKTSKEYKRAVIKDRKRSIDGLNKAISVLEENVNTSTSNLNLDGVSKCCEKDMVTKITAGELVKHCEICGSPF